MNHQPMVVTPENRATPLNVVGEHVTVLASSAQTGSFEIFHQTGPENSGPPPHSHPWDEAFFVVHGEVEFTVGDLSSVATPGTLVQVPADTVHCFRIAVDGAQMLSVTSRHGASELFQDIDRNISPVDPDLGALLAIGTAHGLTLAM